MAVPAFRDVLLGEGDVRGDGAIQEVQWVGLYDGPHGRRE